jgi:hypothetical protein
MITPHFINFQAMISIYTHLLLQPVDRRKSPLLTDPKVDICTIWYLALRAVDRPKTPLLSEPQAMITHAHLVPLPVVRPKTLLLSENQAMISIHIHLSL